VNLCVEKLPSRRDRLVVEVKQHLKNKYFFALKPAGNSVLARSNLIRLGTYIQTITFNGRLSGIYSGNRPFLFMN